MFFLHICTHGMAFTLIAWFCHCHYLHQKPGLHLHECDHITSCTSVPKGPKGTSKLTCSRWTHYLTSSPFSLSNTYTNTQHNCSTSCSSHLRVCHHNPPSWIGLRSGSLPCFLISLKIQYPFSQCSQITPEQNSKHYFFLMPTSFSRYFFT